MIYWLRLSPAVNAGEWLRMSLSARRALSEGKNRVALGSWAHQRFQPCEIRDIDRGGKQVGEELRDPDIFEHPDRRFRIDIDQYVDVAGRTGFGTRGRPEQGGMAHTAATQFAFMGAQDGEDRVAVHGNRISETAPGRHDIGQ